jgi:hypothetical protein
MKGKALSGLAAHPGQFLELFNQSSHGLGEPGHVVSFLNSR